MKVKKKTLEEELDHVLHSTRLLIFIEVEPLSNKYHQLKNILYLTYKKYITNETN